MKIILRHSQAKENGAVLELKNDFNKEE